MGRPRHAIGAVTALAAVAIVLGMGDTAGGNLDGPWPDSHVAALWPTFAAVPAPPTGWADGSGWNGAFRRCVQSARVASDFACEYADEHGRVGYTCVAAGAGGSIGRPSLNAKIAPGDGTYGGEDARKVCYSALAYALSLG
jgi:hypothetical protein